MKKVRQILVEISLITMFPLQINKETNAESLTEVKENNDTQGNTSIPNDEERSSADNQQVFTQI